MVPSPLFRFPIAAAESPSRFVVQVCNKRSAASLCKSCMYIYIYIYPFESAIGWLQAKGS